MLIGEQDYGNFTKVQHLIFWQKAWNINVDLLNDSSKLKNMWKQSMRYVHTIEIIARPRISSAGFSSRLKEGKKMKVGNMYIKQYQSGRNSCPRLQFLAFSLDSIYLVVGPLSFLRSYQQCFFLAYQIVYRSYVYRQHFPFRSLCIVHFLYFISRLKF